MEKSISSIRLPIDPSSLSRFRQRIGEPGCEKLLAESIQAGLTSGTVKERGFKRVTVDTSVQEKAITFPTDSKLLNRSRERLVKLCQRNAIKLRQTYARKGPQAALKASRYAHAKQMKRLRRHLIYSLDCPNDKSNYMVDQYEPRDAI